MFATRVVVPLETGPVAKLAIDGSQVTDSGGVAICYDDSGAYMDVR